MARSSTAHFRTGVLLATVDDRELLVILPNGKTIDSHAAYVAFHREWFESHETEECT